MIQSLQKQSSRGSHLWIVVGLIILYGIYLGSLAYYPDITSPAQPVQMTQPQMTQPVQTAAMTDFQTSIEPTQFFTADALGVVRAMDLNNVYIPPKTIIMWTGTQIPVGWKECNGQYGTPDLRGRFPLAFNSADKSIANGMGKTGGEATTALSIDQIPRHNHPGGTTDGGGWGTGTKDRVAGTDSGANNSGSHTHTFTTDPTPAGNNDRHNNMPKYYVVKFLIKN